MPEKSAITTVYSMFISGGAVLLVSLTAFIVNRIVKTIDDNKISNDKEISELKGEIKERDIACKKDIGEAFGRIRDLETLTAITSVNCDNNHGRGKNGKQS